MPRIFPLLALTGTLLGGSFTAPSANAAPTFVSSARSASGAMPNATRVFRSLGLLSSGASATRTRALPPGATTSTSTSTKHSIRTAATETILHLDFNGGGYTSDQLRVLKRVEARFGLLTGYFGDPAPEQQGKTVNVTSDSKGPAAAYQPLANPSSTDGGTIYYRYAGNESEAVNEYNLTRLYLLAFQGPNTFSYDFRKGNYIESWQGGFADAAALLSMYSAQGARPNFNPALLGAYVLPAYDLFNHPELSNAYIYSHTSEDMVISDFRAAMAQAAWLKVAVEDPSFFAKFNKLYYAQVPARTAVQMSQLKGIASSVLPNIEGLSFNDWIRRQYALDTSVTTGQKLYAAISPLPANSGKAGFEGFVQAFTTTASGDETPSSGYGTISAFDEKGVNINAKSEELRASNVLDFTIDEAIAPGQAYIKAFFTGLGAPDQARITLQMRQRAAETSAVFPYISSTTASQSTYYGVTSYGDSGSLTLTPSGGTAQNVAVARGAWAGTQPYNGGPTVKTTIKLGSKTFQRNTAWLVPSNAARGVGFVIDGAATSSNFNLKTAGGASKVRMISLPLFPNENDEASILGIPANDLDLARYRPNLSPTTLKDGVLEFGIGSDKHEIYPEITGSMVPGRGYWLGVESALQRNVAGVEPPRDRVYEVPVLGGWNQIGVPFNRAIAPSALKVRYGGFSAVSYAQAVINGWIRPGIWRWKPAGGYDRADAAVDAKLQPFEGYYLYAVPERGVSLVFDPSATSEPAEVAAGWTVNLSAAVTGTRDASNRFGVSTSVAAAKPPAAVKVVTLRFLSSGSGESDSTGAGGESGWADSFLSEIDQEGTWPFVVEGTDNKQRVTLSWGALTNVPKDIKLTVKDKNAGQLLRLTSGGSYKWNSDGKPRNFVLKATRLAIPLLSLNMGQSNDVRIKVTMNVRAKGRLEVRNGAGDTIAVLKDGTFPEGASQFTWNGKLSDGKSAPAGRHLVFWTPEREDDKSASRSFNLK